MLLLSFLSSDEDSPNLVPILIETYGCNKVPRKPQTKTKKTMTGHKRWVLLKTLAGMLSCLSLASAFKFCFPFLTLSGEYVMLDIHIFAQHLRGVPNSRVMIRSNPDSAYLQVIHAGSEWGSTVFWVPCGEATQQRDLGRSSASGCLQILLMLARVLYGYYRYDGLFPQSEGGGGLCVCQ